MSCDVSSVRNESKSLPNFVWSRDDWLVAALGAFYAGALSTRERGSKLAAETIQTVGDAVKYVKEFRSLVQGIDDVEIVVAPTFVALHGAAEAAPSLLFCGPNTLP